MAMDRFLIGYTDNNSGLQTNVKPWLIPDNAFSTLENAYVFRGRVRKRLGSTLMGETQLNSRFRCAVGIIDGGGSLSGQVPGDVFSIGQIFSIDEDIFTVYATGTPATLLSTNPMITMTYDTSDGSFTVTGATPTSIVYFYPATPVMGLVLFFVPLTNSWLTLGFDTQFSYFYDIVNLVWVALREGISLGLTDGSGNFSGVFEVSSFPIGTQLKIGTSIFTVTSATLSAPYNLVLTSGGIGTAVFDPTTPGAGIGTLTITGSDINSSIISSYFATWTGSDSQFFWSINYQGADVNLNYLWTTNFNAADGIRYFDGTSWSKKIINYTKGSVIDTTDGSGDAAGTVPGGSGFIGQVFTIYLGNSITYFTVTNSSGPLTVSGNAVGTGTFDISNGNYTFTGSYHTAAIYFTGTNQVDTCLLMIQFQNHLLLLNTKETFNGTVTNYFNRIRYSAFGNPFLPQSFMQDVPGGGNVINVSVQEPIVTAQFIKDRLIIYFTNSTYELVYTNNPSLPFYVQKINTELGAESTFSEIPFDKQVLGIDNIGVHACNGANVERIDQVIPQLSFQINNVDAGPQRVIGIRNYYPELVMWTYPNQNRNNYFYFPNKTLIYNYTNQTWAMFDDSVTFWGYFFQTDITPGPKWGTTYSPWEDLTILWNSGSSAQSNNRFQTVIAGNQQGFVKIVQQDISSNAPTLQITNVTAQSTGMMTISCINHNLAIGDYILLSNMTGLIFTESIIKPSPKVLPTVMAVVITDTVNTNSSNSFSVRLLDNILQGVQIAGTYIGGGVAARVDQIDITTKQYNFYTGEDRSIYLSKVDFLVGATNFGEISVDFLRSSSNSAIISGGPSAGVLTGTNSLETFPYPLVPFEQFQSRLWHPLYFYAEGQCVQFNFNMNARQMFNYVLDSNNVPTYTALQDFQLHAMSIYAMPTSSRMQ